MKAKYCPLLCELCPLRRHGDRTRWKVYSRSRQKMESKKRIRDEENESVFADEMKEAA